MSGFEIAAIVSIAALVWLWFDSLKAREAAVRAARAACGSEMVMLLDDTVAISGIKAVRDDDGRLKLQRVYVFEFTDSGDNRLKGSIVLVGHRVVIVNIGSRDGAARRTLH
jgi:hypothetical protein